MKSALIAAVVAAAVAATGAGATLAHQQIQVKRVVGTATVIPAGSNGFAWASCPGHLKASGGGLVDAPFSAQPVQLNGSYPLSGGSTWEIAVTNPNTASATIEAAVVCVG